MTRTSKTGNVFLAVAFILYLASMTSQSGLLLFPIGILIGCFLLNYAGARRTVKCLKVEPAASVHMGEGQKLTQPWKLTNPTDKPLGFVRIAGPDGTLLEVGVLGPGQSCSLVPSAAFARRGVHRFADLRMSSYYPFGLLQVGRRLEVTGEVVVYPAVYEARVPAAAGYDVMVGGKFRGGRHSASGSSFSGVRPLQPSDPLKHIHWKSSAKGFGLMTKTFDEELSGRIGLIVDAGASGDPDVLDHCLRAAGSLMFAALDEGHHVEWVELGTRELRLVPPFADGHEILDALARIELAKDCLTEESLRAAGGRVSRKGSIVLVLTRVTEAVEEVVCHWVNQHRKVSVYLPAGTAIPSAWQGLPTFGYEARGIHPLNV